MVSLAAPAGAPAATDPLLSAARDLRSRGCEGRPGITTELSRDRALDGVARRWAANRGDLADAFAAQRVRVRESASVAMRGRSRPAADVAAALARNLCGELTDPRWTRIGWHADREGTWVVVAVPSAPPGPRDRAAVAREVLDHANAVRARGARCGGETFGPAPPLTLDERLAKAAHVHAEEMARFGFLAHEGRDGSTPAVRARRAGYEWSAVGENLAAGPETAEEVVRGWEASPPHCRNLVDPAFTQMGVAWAASPRPTGHGTWWAMVLARPRR